MRNIFGLIVSIIFIGLVLVCGKVFEKAGKVTGVQTCALPI